MMKTATKNWKRRQVKLYEHDRKCLQVFNERYAAWQADYDNQDKYQAMQEAYKAVLHNVYSVTSQLTGGRDA
jgi:conjugal transfer/entry exclusion protein